MWLTKITKFIKDNNVKSFVYHTWRDLENEKEEKVGEIRVLVLDDGIARVEYHCPKCGKEFYEEKTWKRPFSVKCQNCGQLIRVPKLKDQIKKKTK